MKLIRNPHLSENLISLFNAEDYIAQPFLLGEIVIPIIDVSRFTAKNITAKITSSDIADATFGIIMSVPKGKQWEIQAYTITRASGDGTFTFISLLKNIANSNMIYLVEQIASSGYISGVLPQRLILDSDDTLYIYQNASTGSSTYEANLLVIERDMPDYTIS